ncbi:MAG: hypothetical protein KC516_03460 [Nanoarchaeota archaeon]|nr:hypothetical protein [Nanoarchaeota archaeon]
MKRFIFFFVFALMILIPLASSVEIIGKDTLQRGETFVVEVSGNFLSNIQKSDISFYRRHLPTSIADYDFIKIDNKYYIYAKVNLEKIPDNYSMIISGVSYYSGTQIIDDEIIYNFTIVDNTTDFWLYPGALITEDNFSIEVQNLQPNKITIEINKKDNGWNGWFSNFFGSGDENEDTQTIELLSGEIKNIDFNLENETGLREIRFSSENTEYYIPVYNVYNPTIQEENITETNETQNNETSNQTNEPENNSAEDVIIEIEVTDENGTIEIVPVEDAKKRTCEELNGESCEDGEGISCTGEIFYASDVRCCLNGACEAKQKSNTGKVIGWIILIVVALIVIGFLKKNFKKSGKKVDLLKVGKKR